MEIKVDQKTPLECQRSDDLLYDV